MKKKVMLKMMFPVSIISLGANLFFLCGNTSRRYSSAKQQDIVINNGTEVSSLIHIKWKGTRKYIILNLLEGLTYMGPKNEESMPGLPLNGRALKTIKHGLSIYADDAKWSDGTPVTADDLL